MQVEYLATVSLEKLLSEIDGEVKGEAGRYLTTKSEMIVFSRQKLKQEKARRNRHFCPLDRAIGDEPRQETTLWVKRRAHIMIPSVRQHYYRVPKLERK